MAYSLRLCKVYLKNFIGIETGLGKTELEVDFDKLKDKNIICILGDNGTGKSTFSSVLHPLVGTTDKRNKFIIDDKEGVKKIWYERSDGCKYVCKIVYTPTKSGHTTKGFIKKKYKNGDEVELNPNGNISSYKDMLFEEFGISDAFLKLASQNDVCKGHVDMTSTERKVNISSFLPDDIYSAPYAVVDKIYKEMKMRINVLVDAIGKMHDDETLTIELERVTNKINSLVEKRDKCIGKIKEYETRIDILKSESIQEKEKVLERIIKNLSGEYSSIINNIDIYLSNLSECVSKDLLSKSNIETTIEKYNKTKSDLNIEKSVTENNLQLLKMNRNDLSDKIQKKKIIVTDISGDKSLNELTNLLVMYEKKIDEYEKLFENFDSSLTVNDFMSGYTIVDQIRSSIDNITSSYDSDLISIAIKQNRESYYRSHYEELTNEYKKCQIEKNELEKSLYTLNENSDLKDILDKRPANCTIDDCPFISNARKWISIEKQISEISEGIKKVDKKINDIEKNLKKEYEICKIYDSINSLYSYVKASMHIIDKLPYSEAYKTLPALHDAILKRGNTLNKCDDFEKYIHIIELRDDYNDLKFVKIPTTKNNIRMIESQGKFLEDAKSEIESLEREYENLCEKIDLIEEKYKKSSNEYSEISDIVTDLEKLSALYSNEESISSELSEKKTEQESNEKKLSELFDYKDKLKDKKERLEEIDDELNPLTRERELYKMEQLKIADNKQELAVLNNDMYKCEVIRSALSVKDDGIPVDALDYFMESIRTNANSLLSGAFNGSLYLEEFIINSKDFIIPYKKNGNSGLDISFASSSERSFVSLALTLSIMEEIMNDKCYGTVILDEIDRGFASAAKYKFIEILDSEINRTNITQVFMVTHNSNFYEGYNIGYILFPGADVSKAVTDSCIEV